MKIGECDIVTVRDLSVMIGDNAELQERAAEYLGPDWAADPRRLVAYKLPAHCTRLDSDTAFYWAD